MADTEFTRKIEAYFGSDSVIGVEFDVLNPKGEVVHVTADDLAYLESMEVPTTIERSYMPNGGIANCTNYALFVKSKLKHEGHVVEIVGFTNSENPDCACATEEWHPGGHDFAIVDDRYLVDPWAKLVCGARSRVAYDMSDPADMNEVIKTYGNPFKWTVTSESHSFMTLDSDEGSRGSISKLSTE